MSQSDKMKPVIKLAFSDFWQPFDIENLWFLPVIRKEYNVKIVGINNTPDILFFSCFGSEHLFSNARIKLFFTGENDVPDFNLCDYAISFHHIQFGKRHLRLPLYALYPCFDILRTGRRGKPSTDRGFCSFVVSNNVCSDSLREEFFYKLSEYKQVSSGGRLYNNVGGPIADKLAFLKDYKFNIAFENSRVDGYTTEKLFDALAAGTLPIYWGNPSVKFDVPENCFINLSKFATMTEAIEYVIKVDNDTDLYNSYFNKSPIDNNPYIEWENLFMDFFNMIVENPHPQVPINGICKIKKESMILKQRCVNVHFVSSNINAIERIVGLKKDVFNIFRHPSKIFSACNDTSK